MPSNISQTSGGESYIVDAAWVQRSQSLVEREPWLISFLDLLMVMVTLLVLVVSYEATQDKTEMNPGQAVDTAAQQTLEQRAASELVQDLSVFDSVADEKAFLDQLYVGDLRGRVDVTVAGRQVKLGISDNILFNAGDAALSLSGQQVLDELAQMLHQRPWLITVEGHTDNQPIATPRYPSNWELSTARASQVTRYLIGKGLQDSRLRAIGYADTQPRASNDEPQGRARNRRVELVLSVAEKRD